MENLLDYLKLTKSQNQTQNTEHLTCEPLGPRLWSHSEWPMSWKMKKSTGELEIALITFTWSIHAFISITRFLWKNRIAFTAYFTQLLTLQWGWEDLGAVTINRTFTFRTKAHLASWHCSRQQNSCCHRFSFTQMFCTDLAKGELIQQQNQGTVDYTAMHVLHQTRKLATALILSHHWIILH